MKQESVGCGVQFRGCRRCDDQCEECTTHGAMCDVCKWYRTSERECVADCSTVHPPSYLHVHDVPVTEKGDCLHCHAECRECDGPSHINCSRCENRRIYVKDLIEHSSNYEELLANYSVLANDTVCLVLPFLWLTQYVNQS